MVFYKTCSEKIMSQKSHLMVSKVSKKIDVLSAKEKRATIKVLWRSIRDVIIQHTPHAEIRR